MSQQQKLTALEWARERFHNTTDIAATKTGADFDGWMEDRDYWRQIVSILAAAEASAVSPEGAQDFNLRAHLQRQRAWSERTFGPGARTAGVVDHIRKELREIEAEPGDLREWIDVAILALDGAWRAGFGPDEIIDALVTKQARNEARQWPDWRTAPPDKAIEHVKAASLSPSPTTSEPTTTAGAAPKGSER